MKLASVKRDIICQNAFPIEPLLTTPTVQNRQEKYNLPSNSLMDDAFNSEGNISPISCIKAHIDFMLSFED